MSRSESDPFPDDPAVLRRRMRSYERKLGEERRTFGHWRDGAGKRFLLGSLYMLVGDVDGAIDWYRRKEAELPDDSAEPYDHLSWALALHRAGREREAFTKLYQCDLANLHVVPILIGVPFEDEEWPGDDSLEYAEDVPPALLRLWDQRAKDWARSVHEHPDVVPRSRFSDLSSGFLML